MAFFSPHSLLIVLKCDLCCCCLIEPRQSDSGPYRKRMAQVLALIERKENRKVSRLALFECLIAASGHMDMFNTCCCFGLSPKVLLLFVNLKTGALETTGSLSVSLLVAHKEHCTIHCNDSQASLPLFPSSSSFTQTPVDPRRTRRPMVWITTSSPSSSLRRTSKTTSKQNWWIQSQHTFRLYAAEMNNWYSYSGQNKSTFSLGKKREQLFWISCCV